MDKMVLFSLFVVVFVGVTFASSVDPDGQDENTGWDDNLDSEDIDVELMESPTRGGWCGQRRCKSGYSCMKSCSSRCVKGAAHGGKCESGQTCTNEGKECDCSIGDKPAVCVEEEVATDRVLTCQQK